MSDDRFEDPAERGVPQLSQFPYDPGADISKLDGLDKCRAIKDPYLRQHVYDMYFAVQRNMQRTWRLARAGKLGPEAKRDTERFGPAEVAKRQDEREKNAEQREKDRLLRERIIAGDQATIDSLGPVRVQQLMNGGDE